LPCATREGQQQLLPNAEIDGGEVEFCPPNNLSGWAYRISPPCFGELQCVSVKAKQFAGGTEGERCPFLTHRVTSLRRTIMGANWGRPDANCLKFLELRAGPQYYLRALHRSRLHDQHQARCVATHPIVPVPQLPNRAASSCSLCAPSCGLRARVQGFCALRSLRRECDETAHRPRDVPWCRYASKRAHCRGVRRPIP